MTLVRELRGKALDLFSDGSTINLAYYEVGNAIWRECFLLKRIVPTEAAKLLKSIFMAIKAMDVTALEDGELGEVALRTAGKLNVTYCNSTYLTEAKRLNRTLVTDDAKLAKAAESAGVKTLTSKALHAH